jgi:hypothetical protein
MQPKTDSLEGLTTMVRDKKGLKPSKKSEFLYHTHLAIFPEDDMSPFLVHPRD